MTERLKIFTTLMEKHQFDFFIINTGDEYFSEHPEENRKRLKWICGFTGSNGVLIVSKKGKSQFFTDGRYTLQAQKELDSSLYDIHNIKDMLPWDWAKQNSSSFIHGYDSELITTYQFERYNCSLKKAPFNFIDSIWHRDFKLKQKITSHPIQYSGISSADKCLSIAKNFSREKCMLITDSCLLSWLLNIRKDDFIYNPAVFGNAVLYQNGSVEACFYGDCLFEKDSFGDHVNILTENDFNNSLKTIDDVSIDKKTISMQMFDILAQKNILSHENDILKTAMAKKNHVEIQGAINAHVRDGVAVINFLYWLDTQTRKGEKLTEISAENKLYALRSKLDLFRGSSFATISAFQENAAIIHYRATKDTNKSLDGDGLYLIDSGGQYFDGTTDITRTVLIGESATDEQKIRFTEVLKGHIAIASAVFPLGTTGAQLDALARINLWESLKDYQHGTGHGVGSYLGVHEGPQSISSKNHVTLEEGMILSNEPGFYKPEEYGIRLENLMYIHKIDEKFLGFTPLTCVPFDARLIELSMLTCSEIDWLQDYHKFVCNSTSNYLKPDVSLWLQDKCKIYS